MAITVAKKLSDFSGFLSAEQAGPIFEDAARQSAVMRLVPEMPLGASGVAITTVTGRPTAYWPGEATAKGATQGARSLVTMAPKKLAAICVNSTEVVRANPGGYVTGLRASLAEAFAVAFDYAALYGLGGDGTGSGPFDACIADTTKAIEFGTGATIYNDVVGGLRQLVDDGKRLTGFAFGPVAEPIFLDAVDDNKRPLFLDVPLEDAVTPIRAGRMIGRPAFIAEGVDNIGTVGGITVGFGGNWNKARWGVIGGINYTVSTEATVTINGTLVSCFENNLVAILAEAEYGFVLEDEEDYVAYTEASLS